MFLLLGLDIDQSFQTRPHQKVGRINSLHVRARSPYGRAEATEEGRLSVQTPMRSPG